MRFNAMITDHKGVDIFCKVITLASKLCTKKCVIRIMPHEFSIVNSYNVRDGISINFRMIQEEVFESYVVEGLTAHHNAIYFEVSTNDLINSISSRESQMRLKLLKKDDVPHLRIELTTSSIVNQIPITFVLFKHWEDYSSPDMGLPSVAVCLPQPKTLSKILTSIKTMGSKRALFKANNIGDFQIDAATDTAKFEVIAQDLANLTILRFPSQEMHPEDEFYTALLNLKTLSPFVFGLQSVSSKLTMKVVDERGAIFSAKEPEFELTLYISGLNQEH